MSGKDHQKKRRKIWAPIKGGWGWGREEKPPQKIKIKKFSAVKIALYDNSIAAPPPSFNRKSSLSNITQQTVLGTSTWKQM
jgi:hypothetical protein